MLRKRRLARLLAGSAVQPWQDRHGDATVHGQLRGQSPGELHQVRLPAGALVLQRVEGEGVDADDV